MVGIYVFLGVCIIAETILFISIMKDIMGGGKK